MPENNNHRPTIFIVVTRGFIIRNILRLGVLELLKKSGCRTVIFFLNYRKKPLGILRKEFESDQVAVEEVEEYSLPGQRYFNKLVGLLMYNDFTWVYSRIGNEKNLQRAFFWKYLERGIFGFLSRLRFLHKIARRIEQSVLYSPTYASYFEKYKPDVNFSTSIVSKLDIDIMKEARKRGVFTISMPKSWDNVTKKLYRFVPDKLIVQNERMKREVVRQQGMKEGDVIVTGFPQFDWYRRPEIFKTREEFCASAGLDPERKIIFFGSEGRWAPDDDRIVSKLAEWANANTKIVSSFTSIQPPVSSFQLVVRPHFTDVKSRRFDKYKNVPNVLVDDHFTLTDAFSDNWDPGIPETIWLANLLYHCDILVTVASTLTLDAVCFDKPIINVAYGVLHNPRTGEDISPSLFESDHFKWVLETGGIDIVYSDEELLATINVYFKDPSRKKAERRRLLDELCYKVDGKSSERIARAILSAACARLKF